MDDLKEIQKDQYDDQKLEDYVKSREGLKGHRSFNSQRKLLDMRNCVSHEESTHATWNVRSHHGSPDNPSSKDEIVEVCKH